MSRTMTERMDQLKKLLADDPDDAFCRYGLAQEYAKAGDHGAAIEWFDKTIDVDPAYCYAYFHKARSQEQLDDIAGATETLRVGLDEAKKKGDTHAASEIAAYLDMMA